MLLENGNIKNSVNFPNVIMERSGVQRLCVIHRNVPAVIAQITTQLGACGVNVENMTNKSKGEYAYTMVDAGTTAHIPFSSVVVLMFIPGFSLSCASLHLLNLCEFPTLGYDIGCFSPLYK
mgnify:CR=1 FL=1